MLFRVTVPPLSNDYQLSLGYPELAVDVGVDGFLTVARLDIAADYVTLQPGDNFVLPLTAAVTDWYAVSRLMSRSGRAPKVPTEPDGLPLFPLNRTIRGSSPSAPVGACTRKIPNFARELPARRRRTTPRSVLWRRLPCWRRRATNPPRSACSWSRRRPSRRRSRCRLACATCCPCTSTCPS